MESRSKCWPLSQCAQACEQDQVAGPGSWWLRYQQDGDMVYVFRKSRGSKHQGHTTKTRRHVVEKYEGAEGLDICTGYIKVELTVVAG